MNQNTETLLDRRLPNALRLAAAREINCSDLADILLSLANMIESLFTPSNTLVTIHHVIDQMITYVDFCMSNHTSPGVLSDDRRVVTSYFAQMLGSLARGNRSQIGTGFVVAMHSSFRADLDSVKVLAEMTRLGVTPGIY